MCESDSAKEVSVATSQFQRQAVRHWNPACDQPTESVYMGVSSMDESASKETRGKQTLTLRM